MTEIVELTPEEVQRKRGSTADEMLVCPKCGEQQGVHIHTPFRTDGSTGGVHIELWNCLSCRYRWWEKYTIKSPTGGVARDLFERIMNVGGVK